MAAGKEQLVEEQAMDKMVVAPPDPRQDGGEAGGDETDARRSGVADQDPLSAHPT